MAKDVMGRFCEYVYANVETLTVEVGKVVKMRVHFPMQPIGDHDNQHFNFQKIVMWYWK